MKLPINIVNRIFEYLADLYNSPKQLHFNEHDETVSLKIHPQSSVYRFLHRINIFKRAHSPIQRTVMFNHDFRTQIFTNPLIHNSPTPISIFMLSEYELWDEICMPICIQFGILTDTYAYMVYTRKQNPIWGANALFLNGYIVHKNTTSIISTISNPDFSYILGMPCNSTLPSLDISLFSFREMQNQKLTTAIFKECGAWIFSNRLNKWFWINNNSLETEL